MLIILDTTETFKDFRLMRPDVEVLADYVSKQAATLAVPEIVVRETINHYRESLRETYREAKEQLATLASLTGDNAITLSDIDLGELEKSYSDYLPRRLRELGATQLNYEGIGLENLIHRALSRRKPFDSKGHAGFRDAVLWETILRTAQKKSEQIVFVTRNSHDFGDHGQLAKDLKEDLRQLGLPDDRVKVCGGLGLFSKEYAVPVIVAKIWLIGRSYAAAIERRNPSFDGGTPNDAFYKKTVAPTLRDSELDARLNELRCHKDVNQHSISAVLSTHGYLAQLFFRITGKHKRSLASKYLHFHLPNHFYLYDSRAVVGFRMLGRAKPSSGAGPVGSDAEYTKFALRMLALQEEIERRFSKQLRPRELDRLLLNRVSKLAR